MIGAGAGEGRFGLRSGRAGAGRLVWILSGLGGGAGFAAGAGEYVVDGNGEALYVDDSDIGDFGESGCLVL